MKDVATSGSRELLAQSREFVLNARVHIGIPLENNSESANNDENELCPLIPAVDMQRSGGKKNVSEPVRLHQWRLESNMQGE